MEKSEKLLQETMQLTHYQLRPFKDYCNALDKEGISFDIKTALAANITPIVIKDLEYSWLAMQDDNISIIGDTGSGKSALGLRIMKIKCEITGAKFSLENVSYDMFDFMMALRSPELKRGDVLMLDEAGDADVGGAQSGAIFGYEANLEKRMRALQIGKIFASPYLRNHVHHYILRCWTIKRSEGTIQALVETERPEGFNLWGDSIALRGYIEVPFIEQEIYDEYMAPKMESIEETRRGINKVAWRKFEIAKELREDFEYLELNKAQQLNYIERKYPEFATRSTWVGEIRALTKPKKEERESKEKD